MNGRARRACRTCQDLESDVRFVLIIIASLGANLLWAQAPQTAVELGLMQGSPPPPDKIVTASNFIEPPFNRWGLAHVREVVPTRAVPVSGPPSALPEALVDLDGLKVDLGEGRSVLVGEFLEAAYTDAFIVLHHGNVVYERYFNDQQPATQHLMWSVTKSFTGTMMLMLMEQGAVDGAQRVDHYLPELKDTAFADATVQQLMDMQVSIDYDETYHDPDADITKFLAATLPGGEGLYANLQGLRKKSADYGHGEAFHYVTPVPDVLGWIIRRVTGDSLAGAMYRMIWSRLGAEYEANYWLDPLGVEMSGGGLSLTVRDAARFGQMILQDGWHNGQQVVSREIARRIRTERNAEVFSRLYEDDWYGKVASAYHDQWWSYVGVNAVAALGIHGQFIYIHSDADVVIAKHSSDPDAESERVDRDTALVMHAISRHLGGE